LDKAPKKATASSEKARYEDLYRADLQGQLERLVSDWKAGMAETPLRWTVGDVELDLNVRSVDLVADEPAQLAEVRELPPTKEVDPHALVREILTTHGPGPVRSKVIKEELDAAGASGTNSSYDTLLKRMTDSGEIHRPKHGYYQSGTFD
jgi:hypothetical protein